MDKWLAGSHRRSEVCGDEENPYTLARIRILVVQSQPLPLPLLKENRLLKITFSSMTGNTERLTKNI
jgi:hypothetical protein